MVTQQDSTVGSYLSEPLTVGEPDVSGPLAVFPLFGPGARQPFVSFVQAHQSGTVTVKEDEYASVRQLTVANSGKTPVLLYEGEEVLGGQQNRSFDVSLLVGAGAKLSVPVSCVEAGRWDYSRHDEAHAASPNACYPELRRLRARESMRREVNGLRGQADQGEVWAHIADKARRVGASSLTEAMSDVYEQRRPQLDVFTRAARLHHGQLGALVAIAGSFRVLDCVARAEVFASLYAPLVQGYALDALEYGALNAAPPSLQSARGLVALLSGANVTRHNSAGLGWEAHFAEHHVFGTALINEDEVVQLTAFAENPGAASADSSARYAHVSRPSVRRRSASRRAR